jgi:cell division protease FtsH
MFAYIYNKNNIILKINPLTNTNTNTKSNMKTMGDLVSMIRTKTKRNQIKNLLISENTKTIVCFIQDDLTNNTIITKTNSNEKMNIYLMDKCNKYNISYSIGNKIENNFGDMVKNDLNFFVNRILYPYLYFVIIFSIIDMGQRTLNIFSDNDKDTSIFMSSNNKNSSVFLNSFDLTNKQRHKDYNKQKQFYQNISLSNWVGSPEIFEECYEIISYQLNNTNYKNLGAVLPKGILMEGPPGVGKTYLAKAIASETNSTFISMAGSEFIELYVGVGALRVRELFESARKNRPSIIFIDEIDAIGGKRGNGVGGGSHTEHDQTLNQLLTEMDGFKDNSEILVLAATNRKDVLDPALLRPGRFDRQIHISLPDKISRKKILELYLKEKKKKERNINISTIAELTDGFSGADLKNLINEAAILAARKGGKMITSNDLTNAMEKLVVGLERNIDDRSDEAKHRVSIHEVGHGFLAMYFDEYFDLQKISIKSTYNGAGGYTLMSEKTQYKNGGLYTKDLLFKKIVILLGGKAAESIWYGEEKVSFGATQDLKQSNQLARKMVEMFGMGSGDLETFYNPDLDTNNHINSIHSEKTKERIDGEILEIISNAYTKAKSILKTNKDNCDEIAEKLLENKILYRKDMDSFYSLIKNITI